MPFNYWGAKVRPSSRATHPPICMLPSSCAHAFACSFALLVRSSIQDSLIHSVSRLKALHSCISLMCLPLLALAHIYIWYVRASIRCGIKSTYIIFKHIPLYSFISIYRACAKVELLLFCCCFYKCFR